MDKDVPYIVYESEAARHERTVKRLIAALLIECCEDEGYSNYGGYSRRDVSESYVRPDGSYRDGGMSYARGRGPRAARDSMGRYSSDGGVDEHTKEELMKLIEKM